MNWFARNMTAMLFGVATSLITAVLLIYVEAYSGDTMFSTTAHDWIHLKIMAYVPVGAVAAGLVGSIGYLLGALVMRLRPVGADALVMLGMAGAMVFLVQSAEFGLFMGGPERGYAVTTTTGIVPMATTRPWRAAWRVWAPTKCLSSATARAGRRRNGCDETSACPIRRDIAKRCGVCGSRRSLAGL